MKINIAKAGLILGLLASWVSLPAYGLISCTRGIGCGDTLTGTGSSCYVFTATAGQIFTVEATNADAIRIAGPGSDYVGQGNSATHQAYENGAYNITITTSNPHIIQVTGCSTASFQPLSLSPLTLPNGTANLHMSVQLNASGGVPRYQFTSEGGGAQDWLTIDSTGRVSGTPPPLGFRGSSNSNLRVRLADSAGHNKRFELWVTYFDDGSTPVLRLAPDKLPGTSRGMSYSATLTASGGRAPYEYILRDGPSWLVLNSATGVLSGNPSSQGNWPVSVSVKDQGGATASFVYSLMVTGPSMTRSGRNSAFVTLKGPTVLAGRDQSSVPKPPRIGTTVAAFSRAGELDFSGRFPVAAEVGGHVSISNPIGSADFRGTWNGSVQGGTSTLKFGVIPDYGTVQIDRLLSLVMESAVVGDAGGRITITAGGLTPGKLYKMQLLLSDNVQAAAGVRVVDVELDGKVIADAFDIIGVAGGWTGRPTKGAVIVHTFFASSTGTATVLLRPDSSKPNSVPVLNGLTIEEL